jgi:hypothetical protein
MRRLSVLLAAAGALLAADAQFFHFNMGGPSANVDRNVTGTARLEPSPVVVGQPCAIVLEMDVAKDVGIENMQVGGLPDADGGLVTYGEFENLPDGTSAKAGRATKRMRLPARFLAPVTQEVSMAVQGMATIRRQKGGMSFTSSANFGTRLPPFRIEVQALPADKRPANFSGAVGTRFEMTQELEPDHVRPGDLVTATYTLTHDGYCPSNVWPVVEHLPKTFKAYDPKEISRTERKVVWTQVLVPQTVTATNSALVSLFYYNPRTKRYEVARARKKPLTFVSSEAASTENTSVVVMQDEGRVETGRADGEGAVRAVKLRIAPSDASPVIAVLPPDTPFVERARVNGWLRLESPRAIGWTKADR